MDHHRAKTPRDVAQWRGRYATRLCVAAYTCVPNDMVEQDGWVHHLRIELTHANGEKITLLIEFEPDPEDVEKPWTVYGRVLGENEITTYDNTISYDQWVDTRQLAGLIAEIRAHADRLITRTAPDGGRKDHRTD